MPQPLDWTPELINRFWDGLADTPVLDKLSFGRLAGPSIVALASPHLLPGTRCLDFGGGSGHFAAELIAGGFPTACFEPSPARASSIEARLGQNPDFLGIVGPDDPGVFGAVFCLEVIEHVLAAGLPTLLASLNNRLAKGGILFLTCPSDEDLDLSLVYCPVCDSTFHRWQHVRSVTALAVREVLEAAGFEQVWLGLVGFGMPAAIARFLSRDPAESWADNHVLQSGEALPIIGTPERIVFVGRKIGDVDVDRIRVQFPSESVPVPDPPAPPSALARADLLPRPVVTVLPEEPSAPVPAGVDLIVSPSAFQLVAPDATNDARCGGLGENVERLVYPGSLPECERARAQHVLPDARELHVFDHGAWRTARALPRQAPPTALAPPDRPGLATRIVARGLAATPQAAQYRLRQALQLAARSRQARRFQQFLDRREHGLAALLQDPRGFPFRLSHYVEGRVLLAVSTLYHGGAERQVVNTAAGLRRHAVEDVHILAEYLNNNPANAFHLREARRAALTVAELPDDMNPAMDWARGTPALFAVMHEHLCSRILNAADYLRRLAPEIVHASLDWTNVTVGIAAALAGVPRIFLSGRNMAPAHFGFFNWFLYPAYRALSSLSNVRMLNNTAAGASDYAAWLNLPSDRVQVLRNGFDPARFPLQTEARRQNSRSAFGIPPDRVVIAGAFRLSAEKRPFLWLDAAAEIANREPRAFFLLAGDGPLDAAVKQHAAKRGLLDRIRFAGIVKDIAFAFAAADLVMLASLMEGTPNVLIEAQAMGIPVVASAARGSAETVQDGTTGRIVTRETAVDFAEAVIALLGNPGFREGVRSAGPLWIEQRFGLERMVDDTLRFYADSGASWAAAHIRA